MGCRVCSVARTPLRLLQPALGAGVAMQMRTGTDRHVIVDGTVEVFESPHQFVHTHRFTRFDDPVCRVSHELKPVGDGIEVPLRHRRQKRGMPAPAAADDETRSSSGTRSSRVTSLRRNRLASMAVPGIRCPEQPSSARAAHRIGRIGHISTATSSPVRQTWSWRCLWSNVWIPK